MNDVDVVVWLLNQAELLGAKHPIMNRMTVTGEVVISDTGLYGTGNIYEISITLKK